MSTLRELYEYFSYRIPEDLREEWDNDGVMCMTGDRQVRRVLVTLDITPGAVEQAIAGKYELVVSHHPLIFHPLRSVTDPRIVRLIKNDIAAFSFHTRLDAADGGVNDVLCERLRLQNVEKRGMMRLGEFDAPLSHEDFTALLKARLGSKKITCVEHAPRVRRVAVLGGDGKDFYEEAAASGADTYLCGNMSYNAMTDAGSGAISVYEAGHFETEFPVCRAICEMIAAFDSAITCDIYDSNVIKTL